MDTNTAYRILGVEPNASLVDIQSAKQALLQALLSDVHPAEQKALLGKLVRIVCEAAELLEEAIQMGDELHEEAVQVSGDPQDCSADTMLEQELFAEYDVNTIGVTSDFGDVVYYEKCCDSDEFLAVAVLNIDYQFHWQRTRSLLFGGGQPESRVSCKLALVILNRTPRAITDLFVAHSCCLVDDRGYQYSPSETSFYWTDESTGRFNDHSEMVAPRSRINGFVLFPPLRKASKKFARCFLRASFCVGDNYHDGNYEIALP